ncbi:uncharacterized protein V6R79_022825 [Siganus canaliculatus]
MRNYNSEVASWEAASIPQFSIFTTLLTRSFEKLPDRTRIVCLCLRVPGTTVTNKRGFKRRELVEPLCRWEAPKSTKLLFALCGSSKRHDENNTAQIKTKCKPCLERRAKNFDT